MDTAKIFLTRPFVRWMQKSGVSEVALVQAVEEVEAGLVDANLGGNLFKKEWHSLGAASGVERVLLWRRG